MGMFDTLWTDRVMPDGYVSKQGYQTKDLSKTLSDYRITDDGHLQMRAIEDADWITIPHHGDIIFYDSTGELNGWHEYVARFTGGKLTYIHISETFRP